MACNPKEYDEKGGAIALTRWIEKMENVIDNIGCVENQKVKYAAISFVNKALTWWNTQIQARGREATIGMSQADFKVFLVEEFCPSNEVERNENDKSLPKCAKCLAYHPKDRPCLVCFNCQKPGHIARNYRSPIKQVAPINVVRGGYEPGTCYECQSCEHYQNTCPKLNVAPGLVGNRLTTEGNQNSRNNGNQVKGRAFNVNAVGDLYDPNVVRVVRIPIESGETLIVQGERTTRIAKALSNVKVDAPELSNISVVRDFVEAFPEDLSRLPPQRQVGFRIDLVATPVAKSPYRLARSQMQELSAQL
nr:reverse transcriptase domain-containing protein [Tanacetum cinerariifolium]